MNILRTKFFEKRWYQVLLILLIMIPALGVQTFTSSEPPYPALQDRLYKQLLSLRATPKDPSRIVVIEVDDASIEELGWPIARNRYTLLLNKLQSLGHPYLLSFLQFQPLAKPSTEDPINKRLREEDTKFIEAIAAYRKVVGSGLEVHRDAELGIWEEDNLIPRVALSLDGRQPNVATNGLHILESSKVVAAQKAFGLPTMLRGFGQYFCNLMFATDAQYSESFVLPSALAWTSAFALGLPLRTVSGTSWRGEGGKAAAPAASTQTTGRAEVRIGYEHCVSTPKLGTNEFLSMRQIERYSFADFLRRTSLPSFAGKVVVLLSDESRLTIGPGVTMESSLTTEHLLGVRFLDELMTKQAIVRDHSHSLRDHGYLALGLAAILLFFAFALDVGLLSLASGSMAVLILCYSAYNLYWLNSFVIPAQPLVATTLTALALMTTKVGLWMNGRNRRLDFARRLRETLSQCNRLPELIDNATQTCRAEFFQAKLRFRDYHKDLYKILEEPEIALKILERKQFLSYERAENLQYSVQTNIDRRGLLQRGNFQDNQLSVIVSVEVGSNKFANLHLQIAYLSHERQFVGLLIDTLRQEISQHWQRLNLLAHQRLANYQTVLEQTRATIMSRFLAESVVKRFRDTRNMEENFKRVLAPRYAKAALLQADIRGYSKLSAEIDPMRMIKALKSLFSEIVQTAQNFGQVKLIGDCIFMFIEENEDPQTRLSPTDQALFVAAFLIQTTKRRNEAFRKSGLPQISFGIAIHYGPVVVGNLSSDDCIDYTVIGPEVNLVARLEELTKIDQLKTKAGDNGIVMSHAARGNLRRYEATRFVDLDLLANNMAIRSFADISHICYIRADDVGDLELNTALENNIELENNIDSAPKVAS